MEDILCELGMSEYVEKFRDEGVSLDILPELLDNKASLEELIPRIGKRLIFIKKVKEILIKNKEEDTENKTESETANFGEIILSNDTSNIIISTPTSHEISSVSSELGSDSTFTILDIPAKKQKTFNIFLNDFNLRDLLQSSALGKGLLAWYQIKGGFDTTRQSYLVDIISSEFINNGYTHLSHQEYEFLSHKIVEIFPSETSEVYFLPPVKKRDSLTNKAGVARGKLVDKFRNKLTFLRSAGVLPKRNPVEKEAEVDVVEIGNDEHLEWLRHNRQPLQEVYRHWDDSFTIRRQLILKDSDIDAIYMSYPILKDPVCLALVERDFARIFPDALYIISRFEEVFIKLKDLRSGSLSSANDKILVDLANNNSIQIDYKHYLMLVLLPSLLPNKSRHYGRQNWRPTISDSRDGIIIKVDVVGDVDSKIKEKENKLTSLGLPVQPFIVAVGPGTTIDVIYVYINKILYPVGTILKALDVCFKCFHVFHLRYEVESEYVWFFIQLSLYNITSKWDNPTPSIIDVVNKVKKN